MSVRQDNAKEATAVALYEEIQAVLKATAEESPANRLAIVERCAEAHAAITFGIRKH